MRLPKNVLKKCATIAGLLGVAVFARATDVAYSGTFVGTEGLATKTGQTQSATYTRDMNTTGDRVSFQIVYSSFSGTGITSQTFTDGSASTGTITVSSNAFVQSSTPTIKIHGTTIAYTPASTAANTAKSISDYIVANFSDVTSTYSAAGVVYATSTLVGTAANFTMTTSSQAALGVSGATMTGGTNAAWTINTPTITIANNGFTTGLAVLYTGTPAISGLATTTTYYISVIKPNNNGVSSTFKLSSTSTAAVAGVGIVLASSRTNTTTDTYTLAPLAFANTSGGGIQLQWSDDNVNWTNATTGNYGLTITSVTFSSGGGTALYDLGPIQHRYLRAAETPPTTGAATYTCTDNERYSFKH